MEYYLKNRNYKEASPLETITKSRNILANIDCFTHEALWRNTFDSVHSVRIETEGHFGTNGKGKNQKYALASAYAEFLERIQNKMYNGGASLSRLIYSEIKKKTGFYNYPDEKLLSKEEFLSLPDDFQRDIETENNCKYEEYANEYFNRITANSLDGVVGVPFYDVDNDSVQYFPLNLLHCLTGTNGMCAGNTPAEAIFQGYCEILERYAAGLVYYSQLTPPSIPIDQIKKYKELYNIIEAVENTGKYKIIIKNFSAGINLPCVGAIVINTEENKYRLNIGCDTHFPIALARCLLEVFQGIKNQDHLDNLMHPIPQKELEHFSKDDKESKNIRIREFIQYCIDGTGAFPKTLFGESSSYINDLSIFQGDSPYEDQVVRLTNFVKKLGLKVYIRDVSFLGFPSYQIYMPKISTLGRKNAPLSARFTKDSIKRSITLDKIEDYFFPFESLDKARAKELVDLLDIYSNNLLKGILKLNLKEDNPWFELKVNYLLVILSVFIEDYSKALQYLKHFIEQNNLASNKYYQIAIAYIAAKSNNKSDEDINSTFRKDFDSTLIKEVISDFNPVNIFNGIPYPNCPNCHQCSILESCNTAHNIDLSVKMNNYIKNNNLNQLNISQIFNN